MVKKKTLYAGLIVILAIVLLFALVLGYSYHTFQKLENRLPGLVTITLEASPLLSSNAELFLPDPDKKLTVRYTLIEKTDGIKGLKLLSSESHWYHHGEGFSQQHVGENTYILTPGQTKSEQEETVEVGIKFSRVYRTGFPLSLFGQLTVTKKVSQKYYYPISSGHYSNGFINGYNIGRYLDPADPAVRRQYGGHSRYPDLYPDVYKIPKWFYRVTEENKDLKISKHFTLGDFAVDYPWYSLGFPQYIALDFDLVKKLEDLITLMNRDNWDITHFAFIYAFRPPEFNLGTMLEDPETLKTPFSMHQYGKAADVIVDEDNDNVLDDLNEDGRIDIYDAEVIMRYVNMLDRRYLTEDRLNMVGGAGMYRKNDFTGRPESPYVHIDVRGFLSEQGTFIRWPFTYPDGTPINFDAL